MIDWPQIFYGAALTTVITAAVFAFVRRERAPSVLVPALVAAFAGRSHGTPCCTAPQHGVTAARSSDAARERWASPRARLEVALVAFLVDIHCY
jgi:hypothetical protein